MSRWELEQLLMQISIPGLAKSSIGLLMGGLFCCLFFGSPGGSPPPQPKTAEEFAKSATYCVGTLSCERSLQNIEQAIKLDPNLARAYVTRGSLLIRQQHLQSGLQDYQKARALYQQQGKTVEVEVVDRAILKSQQMKEPRCLPTNPELLEGCI
jgi:hypothetical protein